MEERRETKTVGTSTETVPTTNIFGWENDYQVAETIWGSIHSSLLDGDLVFAYRSSTQGSKLGQIIVVRNFKIVSSGVLLDPKVYTDFGVGYITSGYTALLPHVPLEYLKEEVYKYLEEWKIDKNILGTYKAIIEDLENGNKQ